MILSMDREGIDRSKYIVPPHPTQVRISEPFCYERDMACVSCGEGVYPDQLALDQSPMFVTSGSIVLKQIVENSEVA